MMRAAREEDGVDLAFVSLSGLSDREKVAALADGALSSDDAQTVLDQLFQSMDMRAAWDEIHAVGDAVRSPEVHRTSAAFMSDFSARLANEPTIAVFGGGGSERRTRLRHGAQGLAAAAAVLMVVWIAFPLFAHKGDPAMNVQARAESAPAAAAEPVAPKARAVDPALLGEYLAAHEQVSGPAFHRAGHVQNASLDSEDPQQKPGIQ